MEAMLVTRQKYRSARRRRLIALALAIVVTMAAVAAVRISRGFVHDEARNFPWPVPDHRAAQVMHVVLPDGRIHLEIEHLPLEGITPQMLSWWYRVLPISTVEIDGVDYTFYHLFHLTEHGRVWVEKPASDGVPGMGIGAVVARQEWFGPYDSQGKARITQFSAAGMTARPLVAGLYLGEIRHSFEATPTGSRYRVESDIGVQWPLIGSLINALLRRSTFSEEMLVEWERHQVEEVSMLRYFLPDLYRQRNDGNHYRLELDRS
jgi:hypothetical protein